MIFVVFGIHYDSLSKEKIKCEHSNTNKELNFENLKVKDFENKYWELSKENEQLKEFQSKFLSLSSENDVLKLIQEKYNNFKINFKIYQKRILN